MRSEKLSQIVLAALHKAGKPSTSADLEDIAQGLAVEHGWPDGVIESLTRMSIAARLRYMSKTGILIVNGSTRDEHGRETAVYEPVGGFDPNHEAPAPIQSGNDSPYGDLTRGQLLTILEVQDEMLSETSRFLQSMQDLSARARTQLADVGLEVPR
jgi:hypothetical protein